MAQPGVIAGFLGLAALLCVSVVLTATERPED